MKTYICVVLTLLMVSCKNELTVQRQNQERDKQEAEKIMDTYFDNLILNQENKNLMLFSEEFFKDTSAEKHTNKTNLSETN